MYINREAMKDNIFEVHQHVLDELRDELLSKMKQLSSDNNEFNHKNITLVLDSYIKKIYKICPYINKSEIYEPYLENYIKFITVVILYTELNTYGYTYPEFIFNTFKEYLWGDKLNISFDQINSCINSEFSTIFDEVNSYGNIINKRRKKNLSNNKFYEVEKKPIRVIIHTVPRTENRVKLISH